jgi:hypothetical protein
MAQGCSEDLHPIEYDHYDTLLLILPVATRRDGYFRIDDY